LESELCKTQFAAPIAEHLSSIPMKVTDVVPRTSRGLNRPLQRRLKSSVAIGLSLCLSWLGGCGRPTDRLEVSGSVTLDGAPLDSGTVRFSSTGGEKLVSTGALIQDGEYRIPQEKGLAPGTYRVEISSPDTSAAPVADRGNPRGPGLMAAPERIPAKYNVESDKTVEVTAEGENRFPFEIVGDPAR
jgi:hypothetical protein